MRPAISNHSRAGKVSSSESGRTRVTAPPRENDNSAKQIARGRANQVTGAAPAGTIGESSNDTCRRTRKLAADQARCASQLVGVCLNTSLQRVSVRVRLAAIVVKGLHPRHADGNFGQAFAPGPAESICDDHRDGKVQSF